MGPMERFPLIREEGGFLMPRSALWQGERSEVHELVYAVVWLPYDLNVVLERVDDIGEFNLEQTMVEQRML